MKCVNGQFTWAQAIEMMSKGIGAILDVKCFDIHCVSIAITPLFPATLVFIWFSLVFSEQDV